MDEDVRAVRDIGCFLGCAVLAVSIFVGGGIWVINQLSIGSEMARIEALRVDAAIVDPAQAEDVIGQVTQVNQRIAENRVLDDIPLVSIWIPDEWSRVEPIPVPVEP